MTMTMTKYLCKLTMGTGGATLTVCGGITGYNPVEAAKSDPDYFSKFPVAYVANAGNEFASESFYTLK